MAWLEYTTISITKDALKKLKETQIDFYGLPVSDNSWKVIALCNLYQDNYKKPTI